MKIYSIGGEAIPACAQFKVNGYTISLSTVFAVPAMAVFDASNNCITGRVFGHEQPYPSADSIARAIAYCQSAE
jgi:hypothetical protein